MWGQMIPEKGQIDFPARITSKEMEMLACEEYHALDFTQYPYVGLDQTTCSNIFFAQSEPLYDRCNISVMFKLIQFHFIVLLNANKINSNTLFKLFFEIV